MQTTQPRQYAGAWARRTVRALDILGKVLHIDKRQPTVPLFTSSAALVSREQAECAARELLARVSITQPLRYDSVPMLGFPEALGLEPCPLTQKVEPPRPKRPVSLPVDRAQYSLLPPPGAKPVSARHALTQPMPAVRMESNHDAVRLVTVPSTYPQAEEKARVALSLDGRGWRGEVRYDAKTEQWARRVVENGAWRTVEMIKPRPPGRTRMVHNAH